MKVSRAPLAKRDERARHLRRVLVREDAVGAHVALDLEERVGFARLPARARDAALAVDDDPGGLDEPLADERRDGEEGRGRVAAGVGDDGAVRRRSRRARAGRSGRARASAAAAWSKPYQRGYSPASRRKAPERSTTCLPRVGERGRELSSRRRPAVARRTASQPSASVERRGVRRRSAASSPAADTEAPGDALAGELVARGERELERGVRGDEPRRDGSRGARTRRRCRPAAWPLRDAIYARCAECSRERYEDAVYRCAAPAPWRRAAGGAAGGGPDAALPPGRAMAAPEAGARWWGAAWAAGRRRARGWAAKAAWARRRRPPEAASGAGVGAAGVTAHQSPAPRKSAAPSAGSHIGVFGSSSTGEGSVVIAHGADAFTTRSPRTWLRRRRPGSALAPLARYAQRREALVRPRRLSRHPCVAVPALRATAGGRPASPLPALPAPVRAPSGLSGGDCRRCPRAQQLYEHVRRGVVAIERNGVPMAIGTVLGGDGRILTALSGLGGAEGADVRYADGTTVHTKVGTPTRIGPGPAGPPRGQVDGWADAPASPTRSGRRVHAMLPGRGAHLGPADAAVKGRVDAHARDGAPLLQMLDVDLKGAAHRGRPAARRGRATWSACWCARARGKLDQPVGFAVGGLGRRGPGAGEGAACSPVVLGEPVAAIRSFLSKTPAAAVAPAPWLGIRGEAETQGRRTACGLTAVAPQSPAEKAGLKSERRRHRRGRRAAGRLAREAGRGDRQARAGRYREAARLRRRQVPRGSGRACAPASCDCVERPTFPRAQTRSLRERSRWSTGSARPCDDPPSWEDRSASKSPARRTSA